MTLMVRQLARTSWFADRIYAFTNTVVWLEYEHPGRYFSTIFLPVVEEFVRIRQTPTGSDIRALSGTLRH